MKRAIQYKPTGPCNIDLEKAKKYWNLLCRIYHHNKYTLVEFTPKGKSKFKVEISEGDANYLIENLGLRRINDETFKNACKYFSI